MVGVLYPLTMDQQFCALLSFITLGVVYTIYRRYTRISIADIRGPKSKSFLLGHSPDLAIPACGVTEAKWQQEFGNIARIKGSFGEDRLWVADPKALQHIYQTSAYNYKKLDGMRATSALLLDRGILWADGDVHKRHRKVMLPAFGTPEARAFLPIFIGVIEKISGKWTDLITASPSEKSMVLDIPSWLSRATLDAIGIAAFDYDFGAVDDTSNPVTKSYSNLMVASFSAPSAGKIFWENISSNFPSALLTLLYEFSPGSGVRKLRENRHEVHKVSKRLLAEKTGTLLQGKGKRDVMSLLVKANVSENSKAKLRDDELIPQMRSILLAGHETTANAVTWTLYELARRPEVQNRMRNEILETQAQIHARGDVEFSIADLDGMAYTIGVMKEALRINPVAFRMLRESVKDDVIPLFTPIVTSSGKTIHEIPVAKGTVFAVSIIGYNMSKDVWGPDADEFKPERWLVPKERATPALGVYGNLFSFSGGVRSCIGWRFAVVEMQAFLINLLSNFEFSIPEGAKGIRRDRSGVMTPMVVGEEELGAQLPLKVTLLSSKS